MLLSTSAITDLAKLTSSIPALENANPTRVLLFNIAASLGSIVANAFANAGLNDVEAAKNIMQSIDDNIQSVYDALTQIDVWKHTMEGEE